MARIRTEVHIDRSQEEVFAYMTDLHNALEWATELVDVTYDGELARGTTGEDIRRMGRKELRMPWKVTAFEPPHEVTFEYGPPFPATARFTVERSGRGSVLRCVTELRPRGLWRLLAPAMAIEARKTDRVQFEKVKDILESRATPRSVIRKGA